ncbi:MAG: radical SAM protein [Bacteroidales bacterium]
MKSRQAFNLEFDIVGHCNLQCSYCYLNMGEEQDLDESSFLTEERFDTFYNTFFKDVDQEVDLNVSFWGGEPLMNFPIIEYIVHRLKVSSKVNRTVFVIITNGTLVTPDIAKFCARHGVFLQVTLDGDRKSHDIQRRTKNDKGTFDAILKNIEILKEYKAPYSLKTTLTALTPLPSKIIEEYEALGLTPIIQENMRGTLHPGYGFNLVTPVSDFDKRILESFNPELLAEDLFNCFLEDSHSDKLYYHSNIYSVIQLFFSSYPRSSCGIGDRYLTIKYDGSIYPCHRFVSKKEFVIGDIKHGVKYPFEKKKNVECEKCDYFFFCGGTCQHKMALFGNDYIDHKNCSFNIRLLELVFDYLIKEFFENQELFLERYESLIPSDKKFNLCQITKSTESDLDPLCKLEINKLASVLQLESGGIIYLKQKKWNKHILNQTAILIWDMIPVYKTPQRIAQEISQSCDLLYSDVFKDVSCQLNSFKESGFLN